MYTRFKFSFIRDFSSSNRVDFICNSFMMWLHINSYISNIKGHILIISSSHTETPDFELDNDLKKTICLRAGGSLRLFVNVTGRPTPAITWSKPGVDLHNRGFIEVNNTSTTLIIDKVHRYDAGKYTLMAENSAGKQEVNILVKVYGKLMKIREVN